MAASLPIGNANFLKNMEILPNDIARSPGEGTSVKLIASTLGCIPREYCVGLA
jgi:hypothetical protein